MLARTLFMFDKVLLMAAVIKAGFLAGQVGLKILTQCGAGKPIVLSTSMNQHSPTHVASPFSSLTTSSDCSSVEDLQGSNCSALDNGRNKITVSLFSVLAGR